MKQIASPNFNARPDSAPVDTIVLHYTDMKTAQAALDHMCDPGAKVSAHYMVDEDGTTFQLVQEKDRAWHAGVSHWRGRDNINDISIGIELVNPGHTHGYRDFPAAQMDALIDLCKEIQERHPIEARNIIAHSDIAPDRKQDPGEKFPWKVLADAGLGLWPDIALPYPEIEELEVGMISDQVKQLQQNLATYGYAIKTDGYYGNMTRYVVTAFRRHFVPHAIHGAWDGESDAALSQLLTMLSKKT